jgi:hypothetical protein
MQSSMVYRYAFSLSASVAFLSGCGGSQPPIGTPGALVRAAAGYRTFKYTGAEQRFKVPAGVTVIAVDALGAAGGIQAGGSEQGALAGRVSAELPVTPGESLAVFVGGTSSSVDGGYNGGGGGQGSGSYVSGAGGGASDIRENGDTLADRILVAGGGGGQGDASPDSGGLGGGKTAGTGENGRNLGGTTKCKEPQGHGGGGGTQHSGGSGGRAGKGACRGLPGTAGTLGNGGAGGDSNLGGGGGGGGYYGGGGGGGGFIIFSYGYATGTAGGGGGGSSYAEPSAKKYQSWRGWKDAIGNGKIVITWDSR